MGEGGAGLIAGRSPSRRSREGAVAEGRLDGRRRCGIDLGQGAVVEPVRAREEAVADGRLDGCGRCGIDRGHPPSRRSREEAVAEGRLVRRGRFWIDHGQDAVMGDGAGAPMTLWRRDAWTRASARSNGGTRSTSTGRPILQCRERSELVFAQRKPGLLLTQPREPTPCSKGWQGAPQRRTVRFFGFTSRRCGGERWRSAREIIGVQEGTWRELLAPFKFHRRQRCERSSVLSRGAGVSAGTAWAGRAADAQGRRAGERRQCRMREVCAGSAQRQRVPAGVPRGAARTLPAGAGCTATVLQKSVRRCRSVPGSRRRRGRSRCRQARGAGRRGVELGTSTARAGAGI
jgi:hypothetical protein